MQQTPLLDAMNEKSTPPSSPIVKQEEAPPSRLAVFGAVAFYMVAALVMVRPCSILALEKVSIELAMHRYLSIKQC